MDITAGVLWTSSGILWTFLSITGVDIELSGFGFYLLLARAKAGYVACGKPVFLPC